MRVRTFFSILVGMIVSGSSLNAVASPQALGVGWDTDAANETLYSVDLETGSQTAIGTFDGLTSVVAGSHAVDPATGTLLLAGTSGTSSTTTLYLAIPSTNLAFSFPLSGLTQRASILKTVNDPITGSVYLLASDTNGDISLSKVAFDLVTGSATLTLVTQLPISSINLDSAGAAAGKLFISGSNQLIVVDLAVGDVTTFAVTPSLDSPRLFVCPVSSSTLSLYALAATGSRGDPAAFYSIAADGVATALFTPSITSSVAGSLNCIGGAPLLLEPSGGRDGAVNLRRYPGSPATDFLSLPLSGSSVQFLAEVEDSAKLLTLTPSDFRTAAVQPVRIVPKKETRCVTRGKAGTKIPAKKRFVSFARIANTLAKVKKSGNRCL